MIPYHLCKYDVTSRQVPYVYVAILTPELTPYDVETLSRHLLQRNRLSRPGARLFIPNICCHSIRFVHHGGGAAALGILISLMSF